MDELLVAAAEAANEFAEVWGLANRARFQTRTGEEMPAPMALARLGLNKKVHVPHVQPKQMTIALLNALLGV